MTAHGERTGPHATLGSPDSLPRFRPIDSASSLMKPATSLQRLWVAPVALTPSRSREGQSERMERGPEFAFTAARRIFGKAVTTGKTTRLHNRISTTSTPWLPTERKGETDDCRSGGIQLLHHAACVDAVVTPECKGRIPPRFIQPGLHKHGKDNGGGGAAKGWRHHHRRRQRPRSTRI